MVQTVYFRADKRAFKPSDTIRTAGHFQLKHGPYAVKMEELLEKARPVTKPKRANSLMVFESEECARDFCAKMTDGRLYRVEIDPKAIRHRGDMVITNHIAFAVRDGKSVLSLPEEYWNSVMTAAPIVEILLDQAVILDELPQTDEDRRRRLRKQINMTSIEDEPEDNWLDEILAQANQKDEEDGG